MCSSGEGKHREETCMAEKARNLRWHVKSPTRIRLAWWTIAYTLLILGDPCPTVGRKWVDDDDYIVQYSDFLVHQ